MTPAELAAELDISPKALRHWLRRTYPRPPSEYGTDWDIPSEAVSAARQWWGDPGRHPPRRSEREEEGRPPSPIPEPPPKVEPTTRSGSDEAYVIDLCDEILRETASRQHTFSWLLGDANDRGQRRRLPVDAYYAARALVVEYRERQHDEPVPHFDKPDRMTVSGVHRGQQRRLYDERREAEVPAHGLRLVIIRPTDLVSDRRGRLLRRRDEDRKALRWMLIPDVDSTGQS